MCPEDLLKVEAEKNPGIKLKIKESVDNGEQVPDEIMLRLIGSRLRHSDCRVNGWVLDGFPQTEAQVNLLRSMHITPSMVILFEQTEAECTARLSKKRLDPRTGETYDTELDKDKEKIESLSSKLVQRKEDS